MMTGREEVTEREELLPEVRTLDPARPLPDVVRSVHRYVVARASGDAGSVRIIVSLLRDGL